MEKVKASVIMIFQMFLIIVGVLLIISMPSVPKAIDRYQEKVYQKKLDVIRTGAVSFMKNEDRNISWVNNGTGVGQVIVPLAILQAHGYVPKKLNDPRTQNVIKDLAVKITDVNGQLSYETIEYVNSISASDFTFSPENGVITKFLKTDVITDVMIPDMISGVPVRGIGYNAFKESNIISIKIPNTVEDIGVSAFNGLSLSTVTIPDSVKTIGNYAFTNNKLTTIKLGSGVEVIGNYAFMTNKLTSVSIPSSVNVLGSGVFKNNAITKVAVLGKTSLSEFTSIGYDKVWGDQFDVSGIVFE